MADAFDADFIALSAVLSGVKEIREAIARAEMTRGLGRRTILFVDEVHRFNKSQQDAFLPFVESGLVTFVGATTENPRSRSIRRCSRGPRSIRCSRFPKTRWGSSSTAPRTARLAVSPSTRRRAGVLPRRRRRRCAEAAQPARADPHRGAGGRSRYRRWRLRGTPRWRSSCAASTRAATPSTTRSRRCTSRCAAPIPMPHCTGTAACSMAVPIHVTSRGASCAWPGRISAWPIRAVPRSHCRRRKRMNGSARRGRAGAGQRGGLSCRRREIECRLQRLQRGTCLHCRGRFAAGAAASPERADQADEGNGLRQGIPLRARRGGRLRRR